MVIHWSLLVLHLNQMYYFSLKSAGLDKYFDKFVCGDHVTRAKPNPEIFNKAIELYNLKKEETFILEDSRNGIIAKEICRYRCYWST